MTRLHDRPYRRHEHPLIDIFLYFDCVCGHIFVEQLCWKDRLGIRGRTHMGAIINTFSSFIGVLAGHLRRIRFSSESSWSYSEIDTLDVGWEIDDDDERNGRNLFTDEMNKSPFLSTTTQYRPVPRAAIPVWKIFVKDLSKCHAL